MKLENAIKNLGENAQKLRIDLNLKQQELAENAGVSLSTIKSFEAGKSISTANLAKILAALDCLDAFANLVPEVAPNPFDLLKLEGKTRQRVR